MKSLCQVHLIFLVIVKVFVPIFIYFFYNFFPGHKEEMNRPQIFTFRIACVDKNFWSSI